MLKHRAPLASGLIGLCAILAAGAAAAETYRLPADQPEPGSRIRRDAVIWRLPLDKTYAELTDAQRALLRAAYVDLPDDDEPPYPIEGMKPVMRDIYRVQNAVLAKGTLFAVVTVDASGHAQNVAYYELPDPAMAKPIALTLIRTRFKPGICAGTPCAMQYPFQVKFSVRY